MAKYKIWLTVKDRYGNTKEVDGGNIDIGLGGLTEADISNIEEQLPLEDYLKKSEIDFLATDAEVAERNTIRYSDFFDKEES